MATFRKSTSVIVSVRSADHENERFPSLEAGRPCRPQIEEKALPKQAAVQEMPDSGASSAKTRAQRDSGQEAGQGVQTGPKTHDHLSLQAYRDGIRQPSAKVANMSVYEILTIVLIAVIGLAATAAIYLGLLNWARAFYVVRCAACHHLTFASANEAQSSCPHCRHPVLTHPLYALNHPGSLSEVRVVGDRLRY
jgi:hypothetical protein